MILSPCVLQRHKPLSSKFDALEALTASIVLPLAPEILPLFFADLLQLDSFKVSFRSGGKMMGRPIILFLSHVQVAEIQVGLRVCTKSSRAAIRQGGGVDWLSMSIPSLFSTPHNRRACTFRTKPSDLDHWYPVCSPRTISTDPTGRAKVVGSIHAALCRHPGSPR